MAVLAGVLVVGAILVEPSGSKGPEPTPTFAPTPPSQAPVTAAATPKPTARGPFIIGQRVDFLGDSYTAGFGAKPRTNGFAYLTSARLRLVSRYYAQGGTGFLDDGHTVDTRFAPFAKRLAPVIADHPRVIVVQGGLNDVGEMLADIQAAANRVLAELRAGVPGVRLVVIGPFAPQAAPPEALATRDVLADVAQHAGALFLDPIAGQWLNPTLVDPDGVHPTNAGHAAIAARLEAELLKL